MENSATEQKSNRSRWLIENIASLAFALLIVFMIRSSVVEAFKIPSGSMIPTLLIGDHIFVNKFAYGFKIPFSDLVTDHPIYIVKRDPPKKGDIIVFMYPKDESFYYIKRVVGVPGDVIEIKNKVLYINNKVVARDMVTGSAADNLFKSLDDPKYSSANLDLYTEHLEGTDHSILLDKNNFMGEMHGPITVPPDSLFVMGDNRDFSNDSRFWGFVPMKNVKGKAMVIWLSVWVNLSEGQFIFRPERSGTVLH
jgi:signal peptidase I